MKYIEDCGNVTRSKNVQVSLICLGRTVGENTIRFLNFPKKYINVVSDSLELYIIYHLAYKVECIIPFFANYSNALVTAIFFIRFSLLTVFSYRLDFTSKCAISCLGNLLF